MYCWAWFILTVIFTIGAMRSSWVLWFTLFFLDVELILLACGYMLNSSSTLVAANSVGFVVAFCSCAYFHAPLHNKSVSLNTDITSRLGRLRGTLGWWIDSHRATNFCHDRAGLSYEGKSSEMMAGNTPWKTNGQKIIPEGGCCRSCRAALFYL
jgi:hypothetical protein